MSARLHCIEHGMVDQLAAEAGVSRRLMFLAFKVKREGCAEMLEPIRVGTLSVSLAAQLVDMFPDHDDQRTVMAEFETLPPKQWLSFARRVRNVMDGNTTESGGVSLEHPQNRGRSISPKAVAFASRGRL